MARFYAWLVKLHASWETMSRSEQSFAIWNGTVDLFVTVFLLFFVWHGLTVDPYAFAFWVPFLAVVLFFRWKQMQTRWKL